jgi:hypothetical protein
VPQLAAISCDILVTYVEHAIPLKFSECLKQSLGESICAPVTVGVSYLPQYAREKLIQHRIISNNTIAFVYGLRPGNWLELAQTSIGEEPLIILDVVVPFGAK